MPTLGIRYRVDFTSNGEEDFELCWAANEVDAAQTTKSVWGDDITIIQIRRCKIQTID